MTLFTLQKYTEWLFEKTVTRKCLTVLNKVLLTKTLKIDNQTQP